MHARVRSVGFGLAQEARLSWQGRAGAHVGGASRWRVRGEDADAGVAQGPPRRAGHPDGKDGGGAARGAAETWRSTSRRSADRGAAETETKELRHGMRYWN